MSTPFLLQVTVLTGPPLETQVRVCDVRSCDSDIIREPVMCKGLNYDIHLSSVYCKFTLIQLYLY